MIAQSNILGMEIIVRNKLIVLEIEYIMQLSNNVCVQMIFFGMDLVVLFVNQENMEENNFNNVLLAVRIVIYANQKISVNFVT